MEEQKIDLDFFWKECEKWVEKFSLHEYWWMCDEVEDTLTDGWAEAIVDHKTMTVFIRIKSEVFGQEDAEKIIRRIAYHEVCETMLTVFQENMTGNQREQARHSVLNKIAYALGV